MKNTSYGPPDSAYGLWYYPVINRFIDEDGTILHDLSEIFDTWRIEQWKRTMEYECLEDKHGNLVELYVVYPEAEEYYFYRDPVWDEDNYESFLYAISKDDWKRKDNARRRQ